MFESHVGGHISYDPAGRVEGLRDGVADEGGWPTYLARYADVVTTSS